MGEPMDVDLELDEFMAQLRISRNAEAATTSHEQVERAAAPRQPTRHWTNTMVDSVLRSESRMATSTARGVTPVPVTRSAGPAPAPIARSKTPARNTGGSVTPNSPSRSRPVHGTNQHPFLSRITITQANRVIPNDSRQLVLFPIPNSVRKEDLEAALEAKIGLVRRIELVGNVAIVYFHDPDAVRAANMFRNFAIDGHRLCASAVPPTSPPKPVRSGASHARGTPSVSSASSSHSPRRSAQYSTLNRKRRSDYQRQLERRAADEVAYRKRQREDEGNGRGGQAR